MNREIKFRAEYEGKIYPVAEISLSDYGTLVTLIGENLFILHIDNINIMQFTGLKDKNGKEVYEGDIIKCQRGCSHEIRWDNEIGGTFCGGMPGWYLNGLIKNGGKGYAWSGDEEVIGNIYQNPELL